MILFNLLQSSIKLSIVGLFYLLHTLVWHNYTLAEQKHLSVSVQVEHKINLIKN